MSGIPVRIYAMAPATPEACAAALEAHRTAVAQALEAGVGALPTTTEAWIAHIDAFTVDCRVNNAFAIANPLLVGSLEYDLGSHWRFGFELLRAGVDAAIAHQQGKMSARPDNATECSTYKRLLTSFQVATTTFHAFGNPTARFPSIH